MQTTIISMKRQVWNEATKRGETKYPSPRVMQNDNTVREYRLAQLNSQNCFAMATLPTTDGELEVDGQVPTVVVIDNTGAETVRGKISPQKSQTADLFFWH